jgi:hypothetical protein
MSESNLSYRSEANQDALQDEYERLRVCVSDCPVYDGWRESQEMAGWMEDAPPQFVDQQSIRRRPTQQCADDRHTHCIPDYYYGTYPSGYLLLCTCDCHEGAPDAPPFA